MYKIKLVLYFSSYSGERYRERNLADYHANVTYYLKHPTPLYPNIYLEVLQTKRPVLKHGRQKQHPNDQWLVSHLQYWTSHTISMRCDMLHQSSAQEHSMSKKWGNIVQHCSFHCSDGRLYGAMWNQRLPNARHRGFIKYIFVPSKKYEGMVD
jgi:hypothetical protein